MGAEKNADSADSVVGTLALAGRWCQIHLAHETNRHPFPPDKSGGSDRLKPVLRLGISPPPSPAL